MADTFIINKQPDETHVIVKCRKATESMRSCAGYSLIELIVVVAILAITAAVVVPNISSTDPQKLDLAAQEFADAIRFARSEAMRTGNPHGYYVWPAQKQIKIYRADMGTNPPTPIYDVYHPVSKKLYTIDLAIHPFAEADSISGAATYQGICSTTEHTIFDEHGIPFCRDPYPMPFLQGSITFNLGSQSKVVTLLGASGRVAVQ